MWRFGANLKVVARLACETPLLTGERRRFFLLPRTVLAANLQAARSCFSRARIFSGDPYAISCRCVDEARGGGFVSATLVMGLELLERESKFEVTEDQEN